MSALAARVTTEQMETTLRAALRTLERESEHYSYAHENGGRGFEYRPDICPGCRYSILRAITDKEVLHA
jgi:hypothetical protein